MDVPEQIQIAALSKYAANHHRQDADATWELNHTMKDDIHPAYRPVVFKDKTAEFAVLTRSTISSKESIVWEDGNEYPVVYVDISSASHPFYTGRQQFVDTMGRVEKFRRKFGESYKKPEKKSK